MIISLTAERKVRILAVCKCLLGNNLLKIRDVASGIGSLVAALPDVSHGALHCRALERAENTALALHQEKFNKKMSLPLAALADVLWWEDNVVGSFSPIHPPPIANWWGGTGEMTHVGGRWTEAEMPHHINVLELHAAYLTLQALGAPHTNEHIRLMLDNKLQLSIYEKWGGGGSLICNDIAKRSRLPTGISCYLLRMSLVRTTQLLTSNLGILKIIQIGAYPLFCFGNLPNSSLSPG